VRVATFNLHAGVDGWGRPTRVLDVVKALDADVMILPEMWRGDDGPDFFDDLRQSLGAEGGFVALARGERVTTGAGTKSWQPKRAHFTGERGVYLFEHRELTRDQLATRSGVSRFEPGTWGLGLLTRYPVESFETIALGRLPRERVQRAVHVARLHDGTRPFYVLAVHGAHISHGSHRQYRRINEIAAGLEPGVPLLIGGDFNCWRPLLRAFLPGWKTLARGRTWPTPHPHSQIDHILGRGPWVGLDSFTRDGGSDHLALVADVALD
jgi:endonuclease/exonuclease/phosphatase family metal-dependent hydrolase